MNPKEWRIEKKVLTLTELSKLMDGISPSYISRVENFLEPPGGRIMKAYYKLSGGLVTPNDFDI